MCHARSSFRDFGSYLENAVGLDEDDVQLSLKENISSFVTYEMPGDIYSNEDISETIYTLGDQGGTLQIEYDEISMKIGNISLLWLSPWNHKV